MSVFVQSLTCELLNPLLCCLDATNRRLVGREGAKGGSVGLGACSVLGLVVQPPSGLKKLPLSGDGNGQMRAFPAGSERRLQSATTVIKVELNTVTLADGERIAAATTVIATGMRASPSTRQIAGQRDELGRLIVDDMLRVTGVPAVFATGDVARAMADNGQCALMSCRAFPWSRRVAGRAT
jgi:hypothetical protein